MAIVTGLEPGAVLWKFSKVENLYGWVREENRHRHRDVECFYVVELYSRRARSRGSIIEDSWYPFLDKLKIRLEKEHIYRDGAYQDLYRAIGVYIRRIYNEEQWHNLEIDEVAQRYYKRINNRNVSIMLKKNSIFSEGNLIEEMKRAAVDFEEETEWPEEPNIPINDIHASTW